MPRIILQRGDTTITVESTNIDEIEVFLGEYEPISRDWQYKVSPVLKARDDNQLETLEV